MPAKTYLVYCQSDRPSDTESLHYHFEYLIQAESADDAEAKCKERFAALPTDGEKLFEVGVNRPPNLTPHRRPILTPSRGAV